MNDSHPLNYCGFVSFLCRFVLAYFTLIVIGVGSTLFHMTLKYEMQLLDEIPMIYGTSVIGYCLYEVRICTIY